MLGCSAQAAGGLHVRHYCWHGTSMSSGFCLSLLRLIDFAALRLARLQDCSHLVYQLRSCCLYQRRGGGEAACWVGFGTANQT